MMDKIDNRINRPFIERMRDDPRMRAMVDGWIAQATATVETRRDVYRGHPQQLMHDTAREALSLALAFLLDNDGEYRAVCEERDRILKNALELAQRTPVVFVSNGVTGSASHLAPGRVIGA